MIAAVRASNVYLPDITDQAYLLVVSQDCDVVHGSYDDEPVVEVLLVRRIDANSRQSELLAGKNPRRLQIRMRNEQGTFCAEAKPFERYAIPRPLLQQHAPNVAVSVDADSVERIPEWLAKRYNRPAFPDEFNDRTSAARKNFVRAIEKNHTNIRGIFIELDTYKELKDEPYHVGINVISPTRLWSDEVALREMQVITAKLERLFGDCPGVEVDYCVLKSGSEFSLDDIAECDEWDLYYLSHRDEFKK